MKNMYKYFKLLSVVLLALYAPAYAQTTTFSYTGSIVSYTVPASIYSLAISASGAQGGVGMGTGGLGAVMTGTFSVTPGDVLNVLTGQQPVTTSIHYGGGGGGGSFVWDVTSNTLLVAAGGGGGGGYSGVMAGANAVTTPDGTNGGAGATFGGAGTSGNGAIAPTSTYHGGGGAGWLTNGANCASACAIVGTGGMKPSAGGAGGAFGGIATDDGAGGFGGGGGSQGECATGYGGGGGGYSGGGAGAGSVAPYPGGGGGGSYNSGSPQSNSVGNTGNGVVTITPVCVTPTGGTITGASQVCVGGVITLSNSTGSRGGVWTSNNTAIATVGASTGFVSGDSAAVDTITYTVTYTCGTARSIFIITVNPLPAPVTGFSNICLGSGGGTTLADSTPGGTWSSLFPSVASIGSSSGLVSGLSVGLTTISYTLTSTGCAARRTINVIGISGPSTVCVGDTFLLTASMNVGTWSSGDATIASIDSTGGVTGVSIGNTVLGYTLSSGCTLLSAVTVNALAPIVGVDSVCVGSNRYLTDIVGGGIWSSDVTSVATVTFDSGKVSGLAAGIADITYMLPSGCFSTVAFNVINFPYGILGALTTCPGLSTTLIDTVAGGFWHSGNPAYAVVDSTHGVVTGSSPGTAEIYYTVYPGCSVSAVVTINPLPAPITGTGVICPGNKDTLHDATPFGVWSSSTPTLAVVDTYGLVTSLIPVGSPGPNTANILYTLPVTGCYRVKAITIDALPTPVITNIDGSLYATTGYATYQWYDSVQGKITGATSPTIAAVLITDYSVVVTDSNGCKGGSAVYYNSRITVGTKNLAGSGIVKIYPNPATDVVFIESAVPVRAVITDLEGKIELLQNNATELNISSFAPGMYFVSVFDNQGTKIAVQKLIKE